MRLYDEGNIAVMAPENSCYFCDHCHDIFYDEDGPYAFGCDIENKPEIAFFDKVENTIGHAHFGLVVDCKNFKEEADES